MPARPAPDWFLGYEAKMWRKFEEKRVTTNDAPNAVHMQPSTALQLLLSAAEYRRNLRESN